MLLGKVGEFRGREREKEIEGEREKESRGIKIDPSVAGTTCNLVMKSIPRSNVRAAVNHETWIGARPVQM